MFFDLILLNRQKNGCFRLPWLAATIGVKYLKKSEVIAIDIDMLCEAVMEFLCSDSNSPRARFSLRLSSFLVNGIIKLHRQKANYFLEELFRIMSAITIPPIIEAHVPEKTRFFETPPSPKVRTKRPRKQLQVTPEMLVDRMIETTQGQLPVIEQPAIREARVDEITIREHAVPPQPLTDEEQFGTLGELLPGEEDMILHGIIPLPSVREAQPAKTMVVEALVHASAEIPLLPEEPMEVEQPPLVVPMEVEPSLVKTEAAPEAIPIPPPRVREPSIKEEEEEEESREVVTRRAKNLRIVLRTIKFVRIDRVPEWMPILPRPFPRVQRIREIPNVTNMLNEFFTVLTGEVARRTMSKAVSTGGESIEMRRRSGRETPPAQLSAEIEGPITTSTPQPASSFTFEEILAPAAQAEERVEPPLKRRKVEQRSIESLKEPQFHIPELSSRGEFTDSAPNLFPQEFNDEVPTVSCPLLKMQNRQQEIVNKISESDGRQLTLEDVCQRPINRMNAARAFSDLLVLFKTGYVNLVTEGDYSELQFIEKGPKLQ